MHSLRTLSTGLRDWCPMQNHTLRDSPFAWLCVWLRAQRSHMLVPSTQPQAFSSAPSGFVAFTTSSGFTDNTIRYACSIDSLVCVSRRAKSGPETKLNCHLHCTLSAKLPPPVNHHQDGAGQQAAWPSFNIQGTMHCHVLGHSRFGIALNNCLLLEIASNHTVISLICCPQAQAS